MNLIPPKSRENLDYVCTWALQGEAAARLGLVGDGLADWRDALTDDTLFGSVNHYHIFGEDCRSGLIFVIDDGWDVPFGTKHLPGEPNVYGLCIPDGEKFASYGSTPTERLHTLSEKLKSLGYVGLGLWISPQVSDESSANPASEDEARAYWTERAEWCRDAGIRYFKIDWGNHSNTPYRRMLTEILRSIAPDVIVEHAPLQLVYTDLDSLERRLRNVRELLPISDVLRLYDVAPPFCDSAMLRRADEALTIASEVTPEFGTRGYLNGEWCAEICAALGLALGAMHNPPEDSSEEACIRWHRVAPPFSAYRGEYRKSDELLTDDYFFDREPLDWGRTVRGKRFSESAPAVMARDCELPTVECDGVKPFVLASRNPDTGAYTIAALRRTVNPNKGLIAPAKVTFRVGKPSDPVGIFGWYASLTLSYTEEIGEKRILAQDLMSDEALDVTDKVKIDGSHVTIDGDELRYLGSYARAHCDASSPSLVIKIM